MATNFPAPKTPPPPAMGRQFGKGSPEMAPPDTSGKVPKSEVFYIRPPGTCGQCSHFIQGGDCELVDSQSEGFDSGTIDPSAYCSLYESSEGAPNSPTSPKEKQSGFAIEPAMGQSSGTPEWEEFGVAA